MNVFTDVQAFHKKFDVETRQEPGFVDADTTAFRVGFIEEEFTELKTALANRDMVEVADALVDIVYVAVGMADVMGIPFQDVWAEVQRSNMAKISGADARGNGILTTKPPRHDQDVLKPLDWVAPDIGKILNMCTSDMCTSDMCTSDMCTSDTCTSDMCTSDTDIQLDTIQLDTIQLDADIQLDTIQLDADTLTDEGRDAFACSER